MKEEVTKYVVYDVDRHEKIAEFSSMDMMYMFMKTMVESDWVRNFQIQCV